jgi:hypothetical protein
MRQRLRRRLAVCLHAGINLVGFNNRNPPRIRAARFPLLRSVGVEAECGSGWCIGVRARGFAVGSVIRCLVCACLTPAASSVLGVVPLVEG